MTLALLMNMGFAGGGAAAATGQSPAASRYRFAYQLTDVARLLLLAVGI